MENPYLVVLWLLMLATAVSLVAALRRGPQLKSATSFTRRSSTSRGATRRQTSRRDGLGKPKGYSDATLQYVVQRHTLSGLPDLSRPFTVLGIETSCDDTGVAIVRSDGTILSNVVMSQYEIHEKFGGIVPSLAMEAHKRNIDVALTRAVQKAGLTMDDIDAISVTKGPGLEICLRVGCRKAQQLATDHRKPFVTIHHLEAHCMMARLAGQLITANPTLKPDSIITPTDNSLPHFAPRVAYPYLAMLASGGHTSLMVVSGLGNYTLLGGTLDDSVGEAFDKAARLLGLQSSSSGGVAVEAAAAMFPRHADEGQEGSEVKYRQSRGANSTTSSSVFNMRVPMRDRINCDFSYAGLKNGFRVAVESERASGSLGVDSSKNAPSGSMQPTETTVSLPPDVTACLCYYFQDVAFTHLEDRIDRALDWCDGKTVDSTTVTPITALVVVGGVAANKALRGRLLELLERRAAGLKPKYGAVPSPRSSAAPLPLIFPPPLLCTDNGVMAAWAGIEKLCAGISDDPTQQEVIARWPLGELTERNFKKPK